MKIKNIPESIGVICILLMLIMINMMPVIGDEIADSFSRIGYKPVPDMSLDDNVNMELRENILYKKWCEETFDNGSYVYEAYKNIAFNIKYTPEMKRTDYWQTPLETTRLKKGDCEDAVLLFFSKMPPDQKNVEIVWGWVIGNQSSTGKAHVWYQLTDKRGMKYIVEGFSNDWNGIIPMEIVRESETRKPILTISHCMINRLSRLFPQDDNWRTCQALTDLFKPTSVIKYVSDSRAAGAYGPRSVAERLRRTGNLPVPALQAGRRQAGTPLLHLSLSGHEFIEYPADTIPNESWRYTQFLNYSPGREMQPHMNKNIANIMKKLHEVFTRLESQRKKVG